jgi:hypothetical protein
MANVDFPMGFKAVQTKTGVSPRITKYKTDGSAIIYPGDAVKKDGSGRVLTITAASDNPMGVAATYAAATAGDDVYVYDDLTNTIFEVQVDDATLTDDTSTGNFFDITVTTGDTTRLISKHELDGDASAEDTLVLRGKADRPGNAWGANVNVLVEFRVDTQTQVIATT